MFFAPAIRTAHFATRTPRAADHSLERFVNNAFAGARSALNVEQDETHWTLSLDVPGLSRDDLSIGIEGAVVRIESKAEAKRAVKAAYELPLEIDAAQSEAKLENGVLTLKLGKLVPASRKIDLAIQ